MTKTIVSAIALSVVATLAGTASADSVPKQVKDIGCLAGSWHFTGTLSAGGQSAPVKGNLNCSHISGDYGVFCGDVFTGIPGMKRYVENDLFGYDPGTKKYHWYAITNAGETHDHVGTMVGPNKARFEYRGKQDGKPMHEVITLAFQSEKEIQMRSETFVDGKSVAVLAGDARK